MMSGDIDVISSHFSKVVTPFLLGATLVLTGCPQAQQALFTPLNRDLRQAQQANQDLMLSQMTDIPLPSSSRLVLHRSFLVGGPGAWTGRAELETPYSHAEMFDFFTREMPNFGWTELASTRSIESYLTFQQGPRIATIHLVSGIQDVGSVAAVIIAPRKGIIPGTNLQAPAPAYQQQPRLTPQSARPVNPVGGAAPKPMIKPAVPGEAQ